ncbi:MAG TPA: LURP-one-related family protein [Actinomycetota bacterium]
MLRRHDRRPTVKFRMREKMFSIGDDSWIEDEQGAKVFKVNGKAMRLRDTFLLEDAAGHEVAKIQERKLHIRDTMAIERGGKKIATVHKRVVGLRNHLKVEVENGPDMKVHGNFVDHEYEIEGDGGKVAEISKRWFRVRDTYGVEVDAEADAGLILAIAVAVEDMTTVG